MALSPNEYIDLHRIWISLEYKTDYCILLDCLGVEYSDEYVNAIDEVVNYLMLKAGKNLCYVELTIC